MGTRGRVWARWWKSALLGVAGWFFVQLAAAHPMPGSQVLLDFREDSLVAHLSIPLTAMDLAFGERRPGGTQRSVDRHDPALDVYLAAHVRPVVPDGRAWRVKVDDVHTVSDAQSAELQATLHLVPPLGASVRRLELQYDVVSHEVVTHQVLVAVRTDWRNGVTAHQPESLGTLQWGSRTLSIDRAHGGWWQGLWHMFDMGMHHIAEGTDHLLFLLVLLLPAPLTAGVGRRWGAFAGWRPAVWKLLQIVTAFTIGHSLTLAIGAAGWLRLPSEPIEVLIAVSILMSALHACWPLFAGRESWVAGGFGLVHGLAFSAVVAGLGLDAWHLSAAVMAFNLGIETAQLAIVVTIAPWLMLLARSRLYVGLRWSGAVMAAVAAAGWLGQRAWGWPNLIEPWIEQAVAWSSWLLLALAALACLSTAKQWLNQSKRFS